MINNIILINDNNLIIPDKKKIKEWVAVSLKHIKKKANITLRTFTKPDMQELNNKFRKINSPTNILAFPYKGENNLSKDNRLLGDLAICPDVIVKEAEQQEKNIDSHFAHIIIHGVLHLAGYTHDDNKNAKVMENTECKILEFFNIDDPYIKEKECL